MSAGENKVNELFVELRAFDCDLGWNNRLVAQYPRVGSEGVWMVEKSALESANAENIRLTKIIAKELSDNDELGCEYTYVNTLKSELEAAKAENYRIRCEKQADLNTIEQLHFDARQSDMFVMNLQLENATLTAQLAEKADQVIAAKVALEKISGYLNEDIANLPCESRQRDLPEDDWEYLMYLRDFADETLARINNDKKEST